MLIPQIALVPDPALAPAETADVSGKLQGLAAALQIQVDKHFSPLWQAAGTIAYFDDLTQVPSGFWPIVITDAIADPRILGFHLDGTNQPYAVVRYTPDWTLTTSHELLEMLADPWGNRLVAGPSVDDRTADDQVRYLVEVCDPVEDVAYAYTINGFVVSDFITPAYHNPKDSANDQYDYTGKITAPRQILPNGYITWEDLTDGKIYQLEVDAAGNKSIQPLDTGPISSVRSLREAVNRLTPSPAQMFRADAGPAPFAEARQNGVRRAAAQRAERLRRLLRPD
ncbi:MAG TPA: hypothetical protein VHT53_02735 [Candidatus Elarobacter sp.]|jgi:hypothetical protein|nr:hypothetical protein [Candidatus Elarobacter sp.]